MMQSIKCVIVGDDTVGKTCIITRRAEHGFPATEYVPSIYGGYAENRRVDGKIYSFGFWDTSGDPRYDDLRTLSYPDTDVFLICFSIVNPRSYEHVRTKWSPEITFHNSRTPVMLIGTKSDLRNNLAIVDHLRNQNTAPIQTHQGIAMCRDIGAAAYHECSAFTGEGINEVIDEAFRIAISSPRGKERTRSGSCIIV